MSKKISLLGVQATLLTPLNIDNTLTSIAASSGSTCITTLNPELLVKAQQDKAFKNLLNKSDYATVDGAGIIILSSFMGHSLTWPERLTGVDLTEKILNLAESQQHTLMCVLSSQGLTSRKQLEATLKQRHPKLQLIVADEQVPAEFVLRVDPHIILVGLGAPEQELWIDRVRNLTPGIRIVMGVGGTFDFISGTIKRAPGIVRKLGLEWLWRLLLHPLGQGKPVSYRLKRITTATIIFPFMVIKSLWQK